MKILKRKGQIENNFSKILI